MPITDRNTFEELYAGQPRWEIGRPQKAFLDVADRITGAVPTSTASRSAAKAFRSLASTDTTSR